LPSPLDLKGSPHRGVERRVVPLGLHHARVATDHLLAGVTGDLAEGGVHIEDPRAGVGHEYAVGHLREHEGSEPQTMTLVDASGLARVCSLIQGYRVDKGFVPFGGRGLGRLLPRHLRHERPRESRPSPGELNEGRLRQASRDIRVLHMGVGSGHGKRLVYRCSGEGTVALERKGSDHGSRRMRASFDIAPRAAGYRPTKTSA
jgi:hypothetical protein